MKNIDEQTERRIRKICGKRSASGQAIAEGAAVGIFLTILGLGLLLLLYNTFVVNSYSLKLQTAAEEVARSISQSEYWLGMQRQQGTEDWEYQPPSKKGATKAQQKATTLGDGILHVMGLLPSDKGATWTFNDPTPADPNDPGAGEIVSVSVKVDNLPLFTGGTHYIPSVVSLSATGVSAAYSAPPGGTAILNFVDPTVQPPTLNHKSIRVPIYCANVEGPVTNPATGARTENYNGSTYLRAGEWQGEFPVAYVGDVNFYQATSHINIEHYVAGAGAAQEKAIGGQLKW